MDAKRIGIMIAGNMPPPSKLKKDMAAADDGDSAGSDSEESDPADKENDIKEGASALGDMFAALRAGDKEEAFSAFHDAVTICMAMSHESKSADDNNSDESDSYKQ